MLKNLPQMHLKLLQKTVEATGDLNGNKIADKVTKISKTSDSIIQKQLKMSMLKKYLKKNIYL